LLLSRVGMCTLYLYTVAHMYIHIFISNSSTLLYSLHFQCGSGAAVAVIVFTTTSAIGAYHNWCEFKSQSEWDVQNYVIKFVTDLRQVMVFSGSSTNKTEILLKVVLNNINVVLVWHIWRQSELQTVYRNLILFG